MTDRDSLGLPTSPPVPKKIHWKNVAILALMIVGAGSFVYFIIFMVPSMDSAKEEKAIDDKLAKMSCGELKNYYESDNNPGPYFGKNRYYSGAGTLFAKKDCHYESGYLLGEEDWCYKFSRIVGCYGWNSTAYKGEFDHNANGFVIWPSDWYYIDWKTGKKYTDPAQYLLVQGKNPAKYIENYGVGTH